MCTSLIRKRTTLGPYPGSVSRVKGGSWEVGVVLNVRYPCRFLLVRDPGGFSCLIETPVCKAVLDRLEKIECCHPFCRAVSSEIGARLEKLNSETPFNMVSSEHAVRSRY